MEFNRLLFLIQRSLLCRPLTVAETKVLEQSWQGYNYKQMEALSGYSECYLKDVGSQLWHELSQRLGKRVSKGNFGFVLREYELSQQRENELASSLSALTTDSCSQQAREMLFPGGVLSVNSKLYITRPPVESLAWEAIYDANYLVRIKGPQQMGKTSLLLRVMNEGQNLNYGQVFLDFQAAETEILASLDRLLYWICCNLIEQLQLPVYVEDYWEDTLGSTFSYRYFLEKGVLSQIQTPFLLIFDQLDRVFKYPTVVQDFLPLLRSCYELSKSNQGWQKIRLVLSYSTEMYIPLHWSKSPFNVGLPIQLSPFNLEQTLELAKRYGFEEWRIDQAQQILDFLNGHPYLLNVAFYHLSRGDLNLTHLLKQAEDLNGIFRHHLQGYLTILKQNRALREAMEQLLKTDQSLELDAIAAYQLEGLGLITIQGHKSQISCTLYRQYFEQQLLGIA
ncbi:MAG: hypothetical protein GVY04_11355 [Cyanobacteria bacterium]|jgi:hypothetical protein|nr:hypothetical protein [Cyanobacteria bacterium GSL.Bin1]